MRGVRGGGQKTTVRASREWQKVKMRGPGEAGESGEAKKGTRRPLGGRILPVLIKWKQGS